MTVTASIDPTLHVWGSPIVPWVLVDDATLTQEVVFTVPDCPTPSPTPTMTPTETPSETQVVIPTETSSVPLTATAEAKMETATDMPVTGSGTDQRGQLIIAVASVVALGIIAFGLRRYSDGLLPTGVVHPRRWSHASASAVKEFDRNAQNPRFHYAYIQSGSDAQSQGG